MTDAATAALVAGAVSLLVSAISAVSARRL